MTSSTLKGIREFLAARERLRYNGAAKVKRKSPNASPWFDAGAGPCRHRVAPAGQHAWRGAAEEDPVRPGKSIGCPVKQDGLQWFLSDSRAVLSRRFGRWLN